MEKLRSEVLSDLLEFRQSWNLKPTTWYPTGICILSSLVIYLSETKKVRGTKQLVERMGRLNVDATQDRSERRETAEAFQLAGL